jgi:HEPN domain-containing protein
MTEQENLVSKWVELSDYDLSAADAMLSSGHLLYVAFLCQQSIEKIFKAVWCERREDTPPFTHNLSTLAESLGLQLSESQLVLMDRLARFYIVGRYPTFKQKLSASLTQKDAAAILKETKELVIWCKTSILTSTT